MILRSVIMYVNYGLIGPLCYMPLWPIVEPQRNQSIRMKSIICQLVYSLTDYLFDTLNSYLIAIISLYDKVNRCLEIQPARHNHQPTHQQGTE